MQKIITIVLSLFVFISLIACSDIKKETGLDSINAKDLQYHLDFLAADEFLGRDTPSQELKIASKYLALKAKSYGLKPLLKDSSFFQLLPLTTSAISANQTSIVLQTKSGKKQYKYLKDFGIKDSDLSSGIIEGEILFLGLGHQTRDKSWDDLKGFDLTGKVVVILDADLPRTHTLRSDGTGMLLRARAKMLVDLGAATVLKIIDNKLEETFQNEGYDFTVNKKSSVVNDKITESENKRVSYNSIQIRHEMASDILGVSRERLNEMFDELKKGNQIKGNIVTGNNVEIRIEVVKGMDTSRNVIAVIEGNDAKLKDEYVVLGAHYDHIGITEGGIFNGANDNGSGTVGLLEIAEAIVKEKPSRTIIFVWFTGEEKGLWGSRYFVANPPVPLEKISAAINLDVISGTDISKVTASGGEVLSSTLTELISEASQGQMKVDYMKDTPSMYRFFFTRSDHFPFLMNGIPAVWFGAHSDEDNHVHHVNDTSENMSFEKMEKVTKLTFQLALKIANHPTMMRLDINSAITSRGKHNTSFDWFEAIKK